MRWFRPRPTPALQAAIDPFAPPGPSPFQTTGVSRDGAFAIHHEWGGEVGMGGPVVGRSVLVRAEGDPVWLPGRYASQATWSRRGALVALWRWEGPDLLSPELRVEVVDAEALTHVVLPRIRRYRRLARVDASGVTLKAWSGGGTERLAVDRASFRPLPEGDGS